MTTTDNYILIDIGYEDSYTTTTLSPTVLKPKKESKAQNNKERRRSSKPKAEVQQDIAGYTDFDRKVYSWMVAAVATVTPIMASYRLDELDYAGASFWLFVAGVTLFMLIGITKAMKKDQKGDTNNG